MSNFYLRGLSIVLIAVTVAAFVSASDSTPAMLKTAGEVFINGKRTGKVTALISRDVIQTTTASNAAISLRGTIVRVLPNSTVVYGDAVELQAGSVEVSTASGMVVISELYKIVPLRTNAKFSVTRNNACSYVRVQEGTVKVEGGEKSNIVSAGSSFPLGEQKCDRPSAVGKGRKGVGVSGRGAVAFGGIGGAAAVSIWAPGGRSCSPSSPDVER